MRFTQALLIATAYAGVTYDDEDGSFEAMMSIDGDNLKVDATLTLKKEDETWTEAAEGFIAFMYALTNDDYYNGKTFQEIGEAEFAAGEERGFAEGKWGVYAMAMQIGGVGSFEGAGALGADEYEGTDAGWTGTQTVGEKEWTISASRPLNAKPAITEGEAAYHSAAFMMPDETSEMGYAMVGPKFTETVVGGAATLAAGATIAATMLF